jgi:gas vesicle protein
MSNNTGNTLIALLAGVAVGAGIGILFAPDKGSKTREKIKDGYGDTKNNLISKLDKASKGIKNKFSSAKSDLEETYEDLVSNIGHKNEDVILYLEKKLADLKEQNAKLQKN